MKKHDNLEDILCILCQILRLHELNHNVSGRIYDNPKSYVRWYKNMQWYQTRLICHSKCPHVYQLLPLFTFQTLQLWMLTRLKNIMTVSRVRNEFWLIHCIIWIVKKPSHGDLTTQLSMGYPLPIWFNFANVIIGILIKCWLCKWKMSSARRCIGRLIGAVGA